MATYLSVDKDGYATRTLPTEEEIRAEDDHFTSVLEMLPQNMIKPVVHDAAAEKFFQNHRGKMPEQARKAAQKVRRAEAKASKRAKYAAAGAIDGKPIADGAGEDDDAEEATFSAPTWQPGDAPEDAPSLPPSAAADPFEAPSADRPPGIVRTGSLPLTELRARYRAKLDSFASNRGGTVTTKAERKEKRASKAAKARPEGALPDRLGDRGAAPPRAAVKAPVAAVVAAAPPPQDVKIASVGKKRAAEAPKKVGAPGSKTKRLKQLVAKAESDKAALAELKASGDESGAAKVQWAEALRVAAGAKAPVDASRLKKALKMREKKKAASKKKWKKLEKVATETKIANRQPKSGKRPPKADAP